MNPLSAIQDRSGMSGKPVGCAAWVSTLPTVCQSVSMSVPDPKEVSFKAGRLPHSIR